MTKTVTIKIHYGETMEHTGVAKIEENAGQITLYDSAGNLLAMVEKNKIESLNTTEESN